MKTSDEIVAALIGQIEACYSEPQFRAGTLGELDSTLFVLHWTLCTALDCMDEFTTATGELYQQHPQAYMQSWRHALRRYEPLEFPDQFAEVMEYWQDVDRKLGMLQETPD